MAIKNPMIDKVAIRKLVEERSDISRAIADEERLIKTYNEIIKEKTAQKRKGYSASVKLLKANVADFRRDVKKLKDEIRQIDEEISAKKKGKKWV